MPVFPDDDSRMIWPARRSPFFSASSIIDSAARSFTDPPGFWPSSLATMRTFGFGLSADTSTIGVLPMSSVIDEYTGMSAAGDRGEDRHLVALLDGRVELPEVPDVLVVQVHVHELVHATVGRLQVGGGARELTHDVVDDLADGGALGLDLRLPAGVAAHDGGESDGDGHGTS